MGIIELDEAGNAGNRAKIKVVGVGGAGGNTLNHMAESGMEGVEFIAINTDAQALERSLAAKKLAIGERALGAGGKPEKGAEAINSQREEVKALLEGADMVFIAAGMGGGTGTGAAPVVAEICRELGILSVAVVTKPFIWEGPVRKRNAIEGIENLAGAVDTLITISNQNLLSIIDKKSSIKDSFAKVDDVLGNAVRGVTNIIVKSGYINVDFNDVRTVMEQGGDALMGMGEASGEGRAERAAQMALECPLLNNVSVCGATGLLVNICGSDEMSMVDVSEAMNYIQGQIGETVSTNTIFGAVIDPSMGDRISVTIIATGFESGNRERRREERKTEESLPVLMEIGKGAAEEVACSAGCVAEAFSESAQDLVAAEPAAETTPSAMFPAVEPRFVSEEGFSEEGTAAAAPEPAPASGLERFAGYQMNMNDREIPAFLRNRDR